jgi:hypothetical protein
MNPTGLDQRLANRFWVSANQCLDASIFMPQVKDVAHGGQPGRLNDRSHSQDFIHGRESLTDFDQAIGG